MGSATFASFLDTMHGNALHKGLFTLILSDLLMGEGEEAEALIIISQEHPSLQEEGEVEEEGDNALKVF